MTLPDPRTAWYAAEWIIRIGALAVVPLRRSPAATASWLLLIFFLPVPGLVLFLMIGRPHFPAWRQKRSKALHPYFADVAARIEADAPCGQGGEIGGFAHKLGRLPAAGGNAVELIDDYDGVVDRLVGDIDGATARIDILVYIFADDATGAADRRRAGPGGDARDRGAGDVRSGRVASLATRHVEAVARRGRRCPRGAAGALAVAPDAQRHAQPP